jgi:hypothetical protein
MIKLRNIPEFYGWNCVWLPANVSGFNVQGIDPDIYKSFQKEAVLLFFSLTASLTTLSQIRLKIVGWFNGL